MVHLYGTFIQNALHRLCITFSHSHIHSYTDGGGNHARHQPAHREQLGVQNLAQGLFDSDSFFTPEPLPPTADTIFKVIYLS